MEPAALHAYANGGYKVVLFSDGTKVRTLEDATRPPVWPEQMDLKITNWCDAGCAHCHEDSTVRGRHADMSSVLDLLAGLPAGVEIAIGGGDPLSHPQFEVLVHALRERGLVPSVTINGRHFERSRKVLDRLVAKGVLFGVGISFFERLPDWDYPHHVVHMIAGVDTPAALDGEAPRKLLILGYKSHGRGIKYASRFSEKVASGILQWYREILWIGQVHHLAFDTLAVSQLKPQRLFLKSEDFDRRYMGDEGQFSLFVDAVDKKYALSSYASERWDWSAIGEMYQHVRAFASASASGAG